MISLIRYLLLFPVVLLFASCNNNDNDNGDANDVVLARVGDKVLKLADVKNEITQDILTRDSQLVVNTFIENWIKEQIMIREAKNQISDQVLINKLTEKFRDDLLLLSYEESIIKDKLDTTISDEILLEYYKSNKSRYKLESTMFQFVFVKINKPLSDPDNLDNIWKDLNQNNLQLLNLYCQNNAEICFLNPDRWYKWEEIKQYIPSKFMNESNIKPRTNRDFADFNHVYKIKITDVVYPNQEPPLSYLRDQATQAILHERKIKLLEKIKAELYEKELKTKKINFTNK